MHKKYNEILKLKKMLENDKVLHRFHDSYDGYQVLALDRNTGEPLISVIEHKYSIGSAQNLLELMFLNCGDLDVYGCITAEQAFGAITSGC